MENPIVGHFRDIRRNANKALRDIGETDYLQADLRTGQVADARVRVSEIRALCDAIEARLPID